MENEGRQRIKEHTEHLDSYRDNSLVRNVLSGDTTFEREVNKFYDLSSWKVFHPPTLMSLMSVRREYGFKDEDINKIGRSPENLVNLLQPFSKEEFDTNKLRYESVREDYKRWNNPKRKSMAGIVASETIGGSILAELCLMDLYFTDEVTSLFGFPDYALLTGAVLGGLALIDGFRKFSPSYSHPKQTNYELAEYNSLHDTSKKADEFIEDHYRKHFVKRTLESETA